MPAADVQATVGAWHRGVFGDDMPLSWLGLKLVAEVGEVCQAVLSADGEPAHAGSRQRASLEEECADVLVVLLALADRCGSQLEEPPPPAGLSLLLRNSRQPWTLPQEALFLADQAGKAAQQVFLTERATVQGGRLGSRLDLVYVALALLATDAGVDLDDAFQRRLPAILGRQYQKQH